MTKSALYALLASSILLYQNLNAVNWKLHIGDLEDAAYGDEHTLTAALRKLDTNKGNGMEPKSRYLGLLWKIAHNPNPVGRAILFEELELLTFAHYVWHAWGFKHEKSMEHQAAEKGQKTEWILRRPQEMRNARTLKSLSENSDMKHAANAERQQTQAAHEAFKSKLTDALKPVQEKLEAQKSIVPTKFSEFWEKVQDTNTMKHAERLIANSIAADDPNHSAAKPPESNEGDILGQLWEVYDSIWRSKEQL